MVDVISLLSFQQFEKEDESKLCDAMANLKL